MDNIDFGISMMLAMNSRIPYRELAENFNMSVNSIHKRIKSMVDLGVIQNFNTKLSMLNFPNAVYAILFGRTDKENKADLLQNLGEHESIFNVTQASGDLYYIHSYLNHINELDPLISFVRQKSGIPNPEIGLVSVAPIPNTPQIPELQIKPITNNSEEIGDITLSNMDYLIINALKDNSRKSVTDISDEIGASTKTVRRHLSRLEDNKLLDYSIDWYPDKSAVVISIIILKLDPNTEVDKTTLIFELRKKFGQVILFTWNFVNLPNQILVCVWTHTMKELQEIETSLVSHDFTSVKVTILINGKMFPTWREKYLDDKVSEIRTKSKNR
ncbi:MAG: winged helix-turn-helix transcriptional regulator [Promethearchaeota archaeon]|jgi:DNA-binding Lrp family transcriptional regulator